MSGDEQTESGKAMTEQERHEITRRVLFSVLEGIKTPWYDQRVIDTAEDYIAFTKFYKRGGFNKFFRLMDKNIATHVYNYGNAAILERCTEDELHYQKQFIDHAEALVSAMRGTLKQVKRNLKHEYGESFY